MERIKQAIEKNKNENPKTSRRHDQQSQDRFRPSSARSSQSFQELSDINYQQTRVIKLQKVHLEKNRILAFNKNDAMSTNFDLLRTQVLQKMKENGWRTLAITSPTPEAGKSVVAINLAMSIAQQTNITAMLADFDLRRPKIGTYLGLPMEKSLNDLLDGNAELPDVLINPDIPRLVILATKTQILKSSETLSSKLISDLVKELRQRYESRIIILDLPPLLAIDDAIALLPQVDCVLMVVANGMSTQREIEDSIRLLPADKLVGVVFNKADTMPMDHYY